MNQEQIPENILKSLNIDQNGNPLPKLNIIRITKEYGVISIYGYRDGFNNVLEMRRELLESGSAVTLDKKDIDENLSVIENLVKQNNMNILVADFGWGVKIQAPTSNNFTQIKKTLNSIEQIFVTKRSEMLNGIVSKIVISLIPILGINTAIRVKEFSEIYPIIKDNL